MRSRSDHSRGDRALATPPLVAINSHTAACAGTLKTAEGSSSNAGPHSAGRWIASFSACRSTFDDRVVLIVSAARLLALADVSRGEPAAVAFPAGLDPARLGLPVTWLPVTWLPVTCLTVTRLTGTGPRGT